MVKVGIMQPYFMPYIGYWQLINAVDIFVILDDVNYIKKGWINRNRILINGQEKFFIIPLEKVSQNKKINELDIFQPGQTKKDLWKKIELSYKRADEYDNAAKLLKRVIDEGSIKISKYIENSIRSVCKEFDIDTKIMVSSEIVKDNSLTGRDKIIEICKKLGGDFYINPIGGKELYDKDFFHGYDVELKFIMTEDIVYKQGEKEFHPFLSFIDMLCWNDKERIGEYLTKYTLTD